MVNIIVAFPKLEEAKTIKTILVRSGFPVAGICTTGDQALSQADGLHDGIIISAYKLEDMLYSKLLELLPSGFELMLLASQRFLSESNGEGMVCVAMPLKVNDFINTVNMMVDGIERKRRRRRQMPKMRTADEEKQIREAKELLMDRNHMTEQEAHRYLQRTSMESGTAIAETARMILLMKE